MFGRDKIKNRLLCLRGNDFRQVFWNLLELEDGHLIFGDKFLFISKPYKETSKRFHDVILILQGQFSGFLWQRELFFHPEGV